MQQRDDDDDEAQAGKRRRVQPQKSSFENDLEVMAMELCANEARRTDSTFQDVTRHD